MYMRLAGPVRHSNPGLAVGIAGIARHAQSRTPGCTGCFRTGTGSRMDDSLAGVAGRLRMPDLRASYVAYVRT